MENVDQKYGKVRDLKCCCCGDRTIGRQWHDQDTGWGLCKKCIGYCRDRVSVGESMQAYVGIRGIHYDLPESGEIEAQIETAMQTRMRHAYTTPAVIRQTHIDANSYLLGFNFRQDLKVGDIVNNDDGSWSVVLAIVH